MGPGHKSVKQVRYLISKVSPLSIKQKDKLKRELESGQVKVTKSGHGKKR